MFQKSRLSKGEALSTLGELPVHGSLAVRAWMCPHKRLFTFLNEQGEETETRSFLDLWQRARGIADHLSERYPPGERVMLFFPQGLDFIAAFLGCFMSGLIAVPINMPTKRRVDRCVKIIQDSGARCALAPGKALEASRACFMDTDSPELDWIDVDEIKPSPRLPDTADCDADKDPDRIAFLQYTSGSTSDPKGVMVMHGNLSINLRLMRDSWELDETTDMVFWQPHHHDMGLIMGQLLPIVLGNHSVLMGPNTVVRQPSVWLQAISKYRAYFAGGPNFIYDIAVERYSENRLKGVDLSCWAVAPNGADVVRATTLDRFAELYARHGFRPETFLPCYGLAEATLVVSGGPTRRLPARTVVEAIELTASSDMRPPKQLLHDQELIGCGQPAYPFEIAIVDPDSMRRCGPDETGEIWLAGRSVAAGYWKNDAATETTFRAHIAGEGTKPYLRTGDIGFLGGGDRQLYISGRLKDVIICEGRNVHPEDIEYTICECAPEIKHQSAAVFGYLDDEQRQRIVATIEIERTFRRASLEELTRIKNVIRHAVSEEHGIPLGDIVFIPPSNLRKTTSGKIQRGIMRQLFLSRTLETITSELEVVAS